VQTVASVLRRTLLLLATLALTTLVGLVALSASAGAQEDGPSTLVGREPAAETEPSGAAEQPDPSPFEDLGLLELGGSVALALASLLLAGVATTTLWWQLHAWRTPEALAATRFSGRRVQRSFSLLVPARHEEAVLGETLDRLAAVRHEQVEVVAIVGHDDPGTEAVARAAAARHPDRIRVVVDDSVPKNKPKALNRALPTCRGEVVGVFDAEDEVHPELLDHVAARFEETDADVVQAGVQLMNHHSSWFAVRNVLEYYFWFRSRLHLHAKQRFIPLGGNTVFFRTDRIREVGGWDEGCLAEDCEVGVRLSVDGATVAVAYDPALVTREETPDTVGALVKQRTRWSQGFLQVLRKGLWRDLPSRRQRLLARYLLAMPFLQAFAGIMIPVSLALMLFASVPPLVVLIAFVPLVPTVVTLAVEVAALHEFGVAYQRRITVRDQLRLVLGTFPYQVLLAVAALRAVWREARGDGSWEKTEHAGLHRDPTAASDPTLSPEPEGVPA
jgi:cellulose synthase/poly-beta-1,6-N-acetylglucosamine synthase-like glycosyltransferase